MFLKSLAAQLYDCFVVLALFFAFTALCLLANNGLAIPPASRWYQFLLLAISLSYYSLSICAGGQTLGMRAWRLEIVAKEGTVGFGQACGRFLLSIPALFSAPICFKNPQQLLSIWTKTQLQSAEQEKIKR